MKVIHIGLPKTGTTYLQKNIFPQICKEKKILYFLENRQVSDSINDHIVKMFSGDEVDSLNLPDNILISNENLVSSFPSLSNISEYADKNLIAFGKDSKILITIRNPIDYLSSVYNQILKSYIISPEFFFLENNVYSKNFKSPTFPLENYNLQNIFDIYKKRFDEVIMIKLEDINNNNKLCKYFNVDPSLIKTNFSASKKTYNEGFSMKSVKILLATQKILNKVGYSLNTSRYEERLINIRRNKITNNLKAIRKKTMYNKFIDAVLNNLNIRFFLKNRVDGIFFKEKFVLDFKKLDYINLNKLIEDYEKL